MKLEAIDSVCSSLVACHLLAFLQVKDLDPTFAATCTHGGPCMAGESMDQQQGDLNGSPSEAMKL